MSKTLSNKKLETIQVRLTMKEKMIIRELAKKKGLNLTDTILLAVGKLIIEEEQIEKL